MARKKTPPSPGGSDFEIGRGKPPRHSRFKPGRSGNPGGRRKGERDLKTLLLAVLEREIELTDNGRRRRVPALEALIMRLTQEGLRGDIRAILEILNRVERYTGTMEERVEELPDEDLQVLERALAGRKAPVPRPTRGRMRRRRTRTAGPRRWSGSGG